MLQMIVLMEPTSSSEEVEAVRARARAAALETTILRGANHTAVRVEGAGEPGAMAVLGALPGVAEVLDDEEVGRVRTNDIRIDTIRPLVPPAILVEELPLSAAGSQLVSRTRRELAKILDGDDDRLLVVVGPCSIHDTGAALDYARRLRPLAAELAGDLAIVMRVYFEKPRTTVGWKGLINDPRLDGSFAVNEGLRAARRLLLEIIALGLPAGCEFLDPISPQFFTDLVTWSAIGARTTESQVHRNLASGLSMPVGFKNGTGGGLQMAIDAVRAAAYPHSFLGVTEQGLAGIVTTRGNRDCHVILRGGRTGPNYDAASVRKTLDALDAVGLPRRVMIDTSHGNSDKDYRRQPAIARDIASRVGAGDRGIVGLLMESFLVEGSQELAPGRGLVYGQSVTDSCMSWETTAPLLRELAVAVQQRRAAAAIS